MTFDTARLGHKIVESLDRMGLAHDVRNYHLLHAAITTGNRELRVAVRALGEGATQEEVDQVITRFFPEAMGPEFVRKQQEKLIGSIESVLTILGDEVAASRNFAGNVGRFSETLKTVVSKNNMNPALLENVAHGLLSASRAKLASGQQAITRMDASMGSIAGMRKELDRLSRLANTDELTGLPNRRAYEERLESLCAGSAPFSLLLLDIDHFKRVNDVYGHKMGDLVLKHFAKAVSSTVRADSLVARIGGEEFAIILRAADRNQAARFAERARAAVEEMFVRLGNGGKEVLRVTTSIGTVTSGGNLSAEEAYESADTALYASKAGGRNRVTAYEQLSRESSNRYMLYGEGA